MSASTGLLLRSLSTNGLVDAFGAHVLCLAPGGATTPGPVGDQFPDGPPAHHDIGFCCLWHPVPAIQPAALLAPQPIVYGSIIRTERTDEPTNARAWQSPHNARAPPLIV